MLLYVLTGFLGSGKTTLLRNALELKKHRKNAAVVNDFGDVSADDKLIGGRVADVHGGSVFCACLSGEFEDALVKLADGDYDNVFVETSGLSNPFFLDKIIGEVNARAKRQYDVASVICAADLTSFEKQAMCCNAALMQAACADAIMLNKRDLVSEEDAARAEKFARSINPEAKIIVTERAEIPTVDFTRVKKKLPLYTEDLTLQKVFIAIDGVFGEDKFALDEMCRSLSSFAQRIKGFVAIDGVLRYYEYINGKSVLSATEFTDKTSVRDGLTVLTALKIDALKSAREIVARYNFACVITDFKSL